MSTGESMMETGTVRVTVETTKTTDGRIVSTVDASVDEANAPAARAAAAAAADVAAVITERDGQLLRSMTDADCPETTGGRN